MYTKPFFLLTALIYILSGCKSHTESDLVRTADSLLWVKPDSCILYIAQNNDNITRKDEKRMQLIYEHALFRTYSNNSSDSILYKLCEDFWGSEDYRFLGEAKYLIGAQFVEIGNNFEATEALKEAEYFYRFADDVSPILKGMLYLKLGEAADKNRLFDVACEYFQLAIPYLKASGNAHNIAVAYHNLGKCIDNRELSIAYIDSALYYSNYSDDPSCKKEIEVSRYYIQQQEDVSDRTELIRNLHYLSDTCQINSYAAILAGIYLQEDRLDDCAKYIHQLTGDTAFNVWSKEQYYVLSAELAKKKGALEQAYELLHKIHEQQTVEIEESAFSNTYIMSQKYEAAREKEMRLMETIKKQRAYIWLCVLALICCMIGGYTYYIYIKGKEKIQVSEAQKKRLEEELKTSRAVLQARMSERLEIARHLYHWSSHHAEVLPDILGPLSPKQAASDLQNWRNFYNEFNLCYNNLLQQLKEEFTDLTDSDLQYIAITFLGFDITDMGFLLNIEKRTIWNRRNSVKQHIRMPESINLDNWIKNDMPEKYGIIRPNRQQIKPRKK